MQELSHSASAGTQWMRLKISPVIGPRYWTAICLASICGTNLGDFLPDVMKLSTGAGLLLLSLAFLFLMLLDRATRSGHEAFYWLAVLTVRGAATDIADFFVGRMHLRYSVVGVALTALLGLILVLTARRSTPQQVGPAMREASLAGPSFWLTMLNAGTLGTVIGDGLGHSFSTVQVGVPSSAAAATLVLGMLIALRGRVIPATATTFWLVVVAVRWWGTNVGDIFAFLTSVTLSMLVSGLILAVTLLAWRFRPLTTELSNEKSLRKA